MSLLDKIDSVKKKFLADIENFPTENDKIIQLRSSYLGRKGEVADLFSQLGSLDSEIRPKVGQTLNKLKKELNSIFDKKLDEVSSIQKNDENPFVDPTLPGLVQRYGSLHVLEQTLQEIKEIFASIGFQIAYGPEVDDEYHNFSALNIPEHHPSRDMQDTFFIDPETILRSHTSNVQVHLMENEDPPIRYIVPGRVYRNEAISYKSYCLFHQVEGIYINERVSFAELKGCLEYFIKRMFGNKKQMRFRPSFFPFTEPSAEVDIWDDERNQWMEVLGCGMVDPAVLENVGYNSKKWHGYAFGIGVERMAMLKYKINDIRLFYNSDIRFLRQFS
tara:strand:+ start:179 stop:1174 length:996 start_codon:yes stop_codon:yes gene_type:complete